MALIRGIAKGDDSLRHFTFDDEDYVVRDGIYYYKVNYGKNKLEGEDAEDEIGFVECNKVIALGGKKPNPIPGLEKKDNSPMQYLPPNTTPTTATEPKKRGRPAKAVKLEPGSEVLDVATNPGTFEYFVTLIDANDVTEFQNKLNDLGQKGWELCGFDTNKTLFGSIHIVAVFKRKRG